MIRIYPQKMRSISVSLSDDKELRLSDFPLFDIVKDIQN